MNKRKIVKYRRIFIILIIVLNFNSAFGQFDYRPGFIVTHDNDTIYGYIDYVNARTATYNCFFKTDSLSKAQKYSPQELKEINVDNTRRYVSKNIKINGISQMLFLEYLLKGSLNLYFLIDKENTIYYFIEKEGVLYELSNKEQLKHIEGETYHVKSNQYIRVLNYLIQESPTASSKVDRTRYNHKSLIQIAKDYHYDVCDSNECIIYTRNQKKLNDVKWQFKIGLSFNYSNSKTKVTNNIMFLESWGNRINREHYAPQLIRSNLGNNFNKTNFIIPKEDYLPGLYLNISPNWRTSFQLEFWYKKSEMQSEQFSIENKSISIPLLIKREFFYHKKISPFIDFGLSYNYYFNPKLSELSILYSYPETRNYNVSMQTRSIHLNDYEIKLVNNNCFGILFGCGLSYNISKKHGIEIEVRKVYNFFKSKQEFLNENIIFSSNFKENSTVIKFGYNYAF